MQAEGVVTPDEDRLRDLPNRVVVGANGAYWRDYDTHYSMCPVSDDNDPVEVVAAYTRATHGLREAATELVTFLPVRNEAAGISGPFVDAAMALRAVLATPPAEGLLDVERLALAISQHHRRSYIDMIDRTAAESIAKKYARTAPDPSA